ncbi:hypothetical protein ACFQAT_10300 [Undibacterium arcticum]|uniref:hypothetical protein n=1 Tax=Undibacterium arcticum TaxID=1762892 RepID=UPI00361904D7
MNEVIIKNEKDAFDLLQKALDQQLGDKAFTLKFDHWPLIEIKLEGDGYDSTITPDMAGALVEIQHAINRTYARTVHHSTNARSLTAEERQDLQFKAKVESGSSLITVDLGKFAEKLATSVADKMTPELLAITIVGVAVAGASLLAYKAYLKNRSEDKVIEQKALTKMALSQEETKRLEIFARALKHTPELAHAQADFDDARNEIVRATGDAKPHRQFSRDGQRDGQGYWHYKAQRGTGSAIEWDLPDHRHRSPAPKRNQTANKARQRQQRIHGQFSGPQPATGSNQDASKCRVGPPAGLSQHQCTLIARRNHYRNCHFCSIAARSRLDSFLPDKPEARPVRAFLRPPPLRPPPHDLTASAVFLRLLFCCRKNI